MSYLQTDPSSRVIPAQVNFLTIYNPELGDTDETEQDQIVFWASRDDLLRKHKTTQGGTQRNKQDIQNDILSNQKDRGEEIGNRLRQIGLARGMVEFANNFSNGKPVSSIETEKSRIVLHELENGWWILASIDLTRLPAPQPRTNKTTSKEPGQAYEYSAREVAPAQLLLAQLLRANRAFLLHHAGTLWEVYHKLGRSTFCLLLEKYWGGFVWGWDVLLHGNPAVDIHGCCTKLAGGGELGVGVGEEEWGSGEREVLEGFIERTDGLVDLIVGRYGDAPVRKNRDNGQVEDEGGEKFEPDPWLGGSENPGPADGVVFSGTGMLARKSLATVSQWMEAIFKHGQNAYGVGENPNARQREKRRKHPRPKEPRKTSEELVASRKADGHDEVSEQTQEVQPRHPPSRGRAPDLRRKAMENSAAGPGIPAPLVGIVERSLDEAVARAASRSSSRSPKNSPTQEMTEEEAMKPAASEASKDRKDDNSSSSSLFGSDKMMKVLTLGYGSSWTLTPKGWQDQGAKNTHDRNQDGKEDKSPNDNPVTTTGGATNAPETNSNIVNRPSKPAEDRLQELDPTPAVSDDEDDQGSVQKLEKSPGRFLVGLSGDLDGTDFHEDEDLTQDFAFSGNFQPKRIFIRTLVVEIDGPWRRGSLTSGGRPASLESRKSDRSVGNNKGASAPKTSAGASVDGPAQSTARYEKLQLGPLQGPLLKRTDPERVAERIKDVIMSKDSSTSASTLAKTAATGNVVFDLVYDPGKLTVRTSIPNIPVPTPSLQESGSLNKTTTVSGAWYTLGIPISSPSLSPSPAHIISQNKHDKSLRNKSAEQWTRIDALNVYSQILNSWITTRVPVLSAASSLNANTTIQSATEELERTVKTSRGWWVLWMKVFPPIKPQSSSATTLTSRSHTQQQAKEAFLIRKSTDYSPTGKITTTKSGSSGRWLLREQNRDTSRGSLTGGTDSAAVGARSISEGVGIDARKWVEGLLHLSQ